MLESHPDWKPSLRLGHDEIQATDEVRFQRKVNRNARARPADLPPPDPNQPPATHQTPDQPPAAHQPPDQPPDHPPAAQECPHCPSRLDLINSLLEENRQLKKELDEYRWNENLLDGNNEKVLYYTGLPTFAMLQALLLHVVAYLPHGPLKKLSPFQQLLLFLMRLRLALPLQHLAHLFRVHRTTASEVFHHTLGVMYDRLSPTIFWPTRECLWASMPHEFVEAFGKNCAVIIDCFEVFTERPSCMEARSQSYSHYKHDFTCKYLIGVTPQGMISFISKGAGGKATDQFVTENCGILDKLLPSDVVLADRGFNIEESISLMYAVLKIPAFTRGRAQLEAKDVEETRAIAHLRIHVERVIGVCRNKYTILNSTVPVQMLLCCENEPDTTTLDKIVVVCCALANLCPSVVIG